MNVSSMKNYGLAALVAFPFAACAPAQAQAPEAALPNVVAPTPAVSTLSPQQIDRLVAPAALYPDQILTDILAASTYPAQVVEAQRFLGDPAHAGLQGAALADAAAAEDWDPSVKALLLFPQVLQMMDADLAWTDHLGRAVIAQQADVMNAVQRLREAAEQSGALASSPAASVVNEGGDILINPPSQQVVYLPSYQDSCVFGPDPACGGTYGAIYWGTGIFLPYGLQQWGALDWRRRDIRLRTEGGGAWRHAAALRMRPMQFNYAPPANMVFNRANVPAMHFNAPMLRGQVQRGQMLRQPVASAPHVVVETRAAVGVRPK